MNRIILIGNGFDLAHGLKTSYKDFIDDYWKGVAKGFANKVLTYEKFDDKLVTLDIKRELKDISNGAPWRLEKDDDIKEKLENIHSYNDLKDLKSEIDKDMNLKFEILFENKFLEHISETMGLRNWVDIEVEYYEQLKKICRTIDDEKERREAVEKLNTDLNIIKGKLEKYLKNVQGSVEKEQDKEKKERYQKANEIINEHINKSINLEDVAIDGMDKVIEDININEKVDTSCLPTPTSTEQLHEFNIYKIKHEIKSGKREAVEPEHTLLLNFNYTNTAKKLYDGLNANCYIINIHGELCNEENPIIFGYGDEMDDDYKKIEKLNDNTFLQGMKSYQYGNTSNYHRLMNFAYSAPFQIYIMGHSCGLSDRVLLNNLFEHDNCVSIKPFYWQHKDNKGNIIDDYNDIYMNISRNFNDTNLMRDRVVDKTKCEALVPL